MNFYIVFFIARIIIRPNLSGSISLYSFNFKFKSSNKIKPHKHTRENRREYTCYLRSLETNRE